jgi:hypothetical protein
MARLYVFADEAGDFVFDRHPRSSRYFIVCTMTCSSCSDLGAELLDLRRKMIWNGDPVGEYFHATEDKQVVRDQVFALLQKQDFQVQATIMEKAKAQQQVRNSNARFYQYGWYYHLQYAAPKFLGNANEIVMTTASVGTQKGQAAFSMAVNDVAQQVIRGGRKWQTNFCRSVADPCLQAADYCTWSLQKKWEKADTRSYDLIKDRIIHEADMWSHGTTLLY